MFLNNVDVIFINNSNLEEVLFKSAIHYAEHGLNVWIISPKPFNRLPENVQPPDKEILKLITFLYLKDYKDLCKHLNGIHMWHKIPRLIILHGYEQYCELFSENFDIQRAAYLTASVLDAASVCGRKHSNKAYLLVSCNFMFGANSQALKTLINMYFPNVLSTENSCDIVLSNIFKIFNCVD